ncbi:MAG: hypothetical protein M3R50_00995, partial [Bacteroidota bacterium]|nr:hypothetical protein [Bacteroidota bacterium]
SCCKYNDKRLLQVTIMRLVPVNILVNSIYLSFFIYCLYKSLQNFARANFCKICIYGSSANVNNNSFTLFLTGCF